VSAHLAAADLTTASTSVMYAELKRIAFEERKLRHRTH
jgi:hypothetical protein